MKIAFLSIIVVATWNTSAEAAQIQNLSQTNQTFDILHYNQRMTVTLAPGEIWSQLGRVTVKWHSRELEIAYDQEYVIWNDDTFGPQRRLGNRSSKGL